MRLQLQEQAAQRHAKAADVASLAAANFAESRQVRYFVDCVAKLKNAASTKFSRK
jgi:hypothetical protein